MPELILLILKYVSAALTVGITFAGSWFFEFTKTDPSSGKRSLTPWGQRAIVFAFISLVCAGVATVWSDNLFSQKSADAAAAVADERMKTEAERRQAKSYREKVEVGQETMISFLAIIKDNIAKLSPQDAANVKAALGKLKTAEDFKRDYPNLYKKIEEATSIGELIPPIQTAAEMAIKARISDDPRCQEINLKDLPQSSIKAGFVVLSAPDHSKNTFLRYAVDVNHLNLSIEVLLLPNDIDQGYSFVFLDGSASPKLVCKQQKWQGVCGDNTEDSETLKVFSLLQEKTVASIRSASGTWSVDPSNMDLLRRTFACLRP
jgi:hypothetical protein